MKYSKNFNRDYEFYLQNKDTFDFSGVRVAVVEDQEKGVSAKQSFHSFDTNGKIVPTKEPDLLRSIIVCKKSINLHIKMWAQGYDEMIEPIDFYLNVFVGAPPPWVEQSLRKQLQRRRLKSHR
jgi:hypothetical protein